LPAFTYFSLNFLMLVGLVGCFVPDASVSVRRALDPLTDFAADAYHSAFGEPGKSVPWLFVNSVILGVSISGPPLFLSWIGQTLAARSAATLPRYRFRAMTCLVSLGFAGVALAISLTPQPFEEEQQITLDFQVVDQVSGQPIAGAYVQLTDPFSDEPIPKAPQALTDPDGTVRLPSRFVVSGERNAFCTIGAFSPWGRWLEVSAVNHRTRRIPLAELLGECADPSCPGIARVALERGRTQEDSFKDLAGCYSFGGGFGGCSFTIEPDGRFAWRAWGCTHYDKEYGYLKRRDGRIDLAPIPHAGKDIHEAMALNYRAIEWGDRVYLSVADECELQGFCRKALFPNRLWHCDRGAGTYLRESDRGKPQTGLPRVPPGAWVGFLANELSLNNEDGTLRILLDALLSRTRKDGRIRTAGVQY
jgi:hypothetical protein